MMNLIVVNEEGVQEVDQVKDHEGFLFYLSLYMHKYF